MWYWMESNNQWEHCSGQWDFWGAGLPERVARLERLKLDWTVERDRVLSLYSLLARGATEVLAAALPLAGGMGWGQWNPGACWELLYAAKRSVRAKRMLVVKIGEIWMSCLEERRYSGWRPTVFFLSTRTSEVYRGGRSKLRIFIAIFISFFWLGAQLPSKLLVKVAEKLHIFCSTC